mmetsp:Transcript_13859/g.28396  ORF Transcript_13859/g.28396 Transcript_13859/m.28396 type:complete len:657 (-) Transcript_13859:1029-2999(-)|eukprot:CAMPEP_0184685012 /NCGR_PEP_ID=MMETSP0312-20130426/17372_1 /TAXON_ID=31354 /ORGANISM="Compsopogon coeruleus, Strain SAG 36.94" /LENGTH=656 /DNA_ID=CAMNT_0027138705 /DNA_START=52 /DNA_END=2022 /DNA_ORIENTATION=+
MYFFGGASLSIGGGLLPPRYGTSSTRGSASGSGRSSPRRVVPGGKDELLALPLAFRLTFRFWTTAVGPGERVQVVGSVPELGMWNPGGAVTLSRTDRRHQDDIYEVCIECEDAEPEWSTIDYKYIALAENGGIRWLDGGDNRHLRLRDSDLLLGSLDVRDDLCRCIYHTHQDTGYRDTLYVSGKGRSLGNEDPALARKMNRQDGGLWHSGPIEIPLRDLTNDGFTLRLCVIPGQSMSDKDLKEHWETHASTVSVTKDSSEIDILPETVLPDREEISQDIRRGLRMAHRAQELSEKGQSEDALFVLQEELKSMMLEKCSLETQLSTAHENIAKLEYQIKVDSVSTDEVSEEWKFELNKALVALKQHQDVGFEESSGDLSIDCRLNAMETDTDRLFDDRKTLGTQTHELHRWKQENECERKGIEQSELSQPVQQLQYEYSTLRSSLGEKEKTIQILQTELLRKNEELDNVKCCLEAQLSAALENVAKLEYQIKVDSASSDDLSQEWKFELNKARVALNHGQDIGSEESSIEISLENKLLALETDMDRTLKERDTLRTRIQELLLYKQENERKWKEMEQSEPSQPVQQLQCECSTLRASLEEKGKRIQVLETEILEKNEDLDNANSTISKYESYLSKMTSEMRLVESQVQVLVSQLFPK